VTSKELTFGKKKRMKKTLPNKEKEWKERKLNWKFYLFKASFTSLPNHVQSTHKKKKKLEKKRKKPLLVAKNFF